MTNNQIVKGSWQAIIWDMLSTGETVKNPVSWVRGSARNYGGRYRESFENLLHRARQAGYQIQRKPGIRGGEWSATYQIVACPLSNNK